MCIKHNWCEHVCVCKQQRLWLWQAIPFVVRRIYRMILYFVELSSFPGRLGKRLPQYCTKWYLSSKTDAHGKYYCVKQQGRAKVRECYIHSYNIRDVDMAIRGAVSILWWWRIRGQLKSSIQGWRCNYGSCQVHVRAREREREREKGGGGRIESLTPSVPPSLLPSLPPLSLSPSALSIPSALP